MKYVTLEDYNKFYSDSIEEKDFNRLAFHACKKADVLTTGVDGVRKLKVAFPTDEDDIETVKASICGVIHLMNEIESLENSIADSQGYVTQEDGTRIGKVITSVSSGSESISYSATASGQSKASALLNDSEALEMEYKTILEEGLRGVNDANGVHLMYMGVYPIDTRGL